MPTYSKIIIAIVIAAGVVYAGNLLFFGLPETEHDFRQARWGMSPEEVRASENPELENTFGDNFIFYEDKIAGYDAVISYMFWGQPATENPSLILIAGNYDFSADNLNPNISLEDFETIKQFLSSQYGKPLSEAGVEVGYGSLKTVMWETSSTEIILSLRDILGDGKFQIDVAFLSKKHKSQVDSALDL